MTLTATGYPLPSRAGLSRFRRLLIGFAGEDLLHERMILAEVDGVPGAFVIITPDCDVYEENYVSDVDIHDVRVLGDLGELPPGVHGGRALYRFPRPQAIAELAQSVQEAEALAGLGAVRRAGALPAAAVAAAAPVGVGGAAAGVGVPGAGRWLVAVAEGPFHVGDPVVTVPDAAQVLGEKGLVRETRDGVEHDLFVKWVASGSEDSWKNKVLDDMAKDGAINLVI